jgi:hypothetical protein
MGGPNWSCLRINGRYSSIGEFLSTLNLPRSEPALDFPCAPTFEVLNLTNYEVLEGLLTRDFHFDKDIRQAPAG